MATRLGWLSSIVSLMCLAGALNTRAFAAQSDDYVHLEVRGTLHSGDGNRVFVEANGHLYQLDLQGSRSLADFAAIHDRQPVVVAGSLNVDADDKGDVRQFKVSVNHFETTLTENVTYGAKTDSADLKDAAKSATVGESAR